MANITEHLTSLSFDPRSGPSPGRRLLALVLVVMLALGSTFPGFALAGEADSEGEGTAPPVEVPVAPDFDPGGEEEGLEEAPAAGGEEEAGAVEVEPEVDIEVPPVDEVTGAATEAPSEAAAPSPVETPEPTAATAPEPAPAQQEAPEGKTSEPVANQSIDAPKQTPAKQQAGSSAETSGEAAPVGEPPQEEAPPSPPPQPASTPPADHGRQITGKGSYVVRSGDCLWHIAAALLPSGAGDAEIASEVARLWRLNEDRIGTGDPNLIYAGTELRLR